MGRPLELVLSEIVCVCMYVTSGFVACDYEPTGIVESSPWGTTAYVAVVSK